MTKGLDKVAVTKEPRKRTQQREAEQIRSDEATQRRSGERLSKNRSGAQECEKQNLAGRLWQFCVER